MDDPAAVVVSSEDSDDSLPLSQLTTKKTITQTKLTKKTKEKKPRKRKKKDPNEPQKPVSAYALFFRDTQAAIKGQKPNATFGEVSKIVASMWDSLDVVAKDTYKKKTENAKKEYLKKLAAYRASVISQQTPDQGLAEAAELAKAADEEEDKPVGKKAKMEAAPIVISSPAESVNSSNAIELTEVTTDAADDSQPTTISVAENGIVTPSDGEATLQTTVMKGQTIQIPRSLLEQAASKPISITVTQMSGEPGNQTKKVIKVRLPEKELHKLQTMRSSRSLLTTSAMVTGANSVTAPVSVPTAPVQEIKPVAIDEKPMAEEKLPESDIMTTSEPDNLANYDSMSMPEPVTITTPEIDQQPITLCEFDSCSNPSIQSPLWDNEYCSSQCVVNHCQDVFTAWVAARSAIY